MRMLEKDAYDDKEINIVREKRSTAEEEVNKMLMELSDIYESNNNIEGVERTADEKEKLKEEYFEPTNAFKNV